MVVLICECGKAIKGNSEKHARKNLEIHRKTSTYHKKIILLKKEWSKKDGRSKKEKK